jgi:transposase InsO family protein
VPLTHAPAELIPAVSSSSGHPVLCPPAAPLQYGPGRIFADSTLSYEEAMAGFVAASAIPAAERPPDPRATAGQQRRAARRAVRRDLAAGREARRRVREERAREDAAWREQRRARQAAGAAPRAAQGRRRQAAEEPARPAEEATWRAAREERRGRRAARTAADRAWRAEQRELQERLTGLAVVTAWLAVFVLVDSCTRECVGLPVFASGAHVTAAEVVAAVRAVLPPGLRYIITDRGVHFTAGVFEEALAEGGVEHVLTARHRPQSNGIAERFVRTCKEWLADKAWTNDGELAALLGEFQAEYNERPHQGRGLAGLSPNEKARRYAALAA